MSKIYLDRPFEECIGYKVFHRKEGRMMLNIIFKCGNRTTISYARYLMTVKERRILGENEHVDHIDENKLNDVIENLQILTPEENNRKTIIMNDRSSKDIKLVCHICGDTFYRSPQRVNFKIKKGFKISCSKKCGIKASHLTRRNN